MNLRFFFLILCTSCFAQPRNNSDDDLEHVNAIISREGSTIRERFLPPENYTRIEADTNSFAFWLRNLKLKPFGSKVRYFDGRTKKNRNVYLSVVDMDIDKRDLQQCADAVMRLRAEYLFQRKEYDKIHFNFLSDGKARYFTEYSNGALTYNSFRKYMRYIFAYANTASLHDELIAVDDFLKMKTGDVLIQKGNPYGHAVIVMDMAENTEAGEKLFMLAQSYMPAQETQILVNPMNENLSPWYVLKEGKIITPEWIFQMEDLRRFREE